MIITVIYFLVDLGGRFRAVTATYLRVNAEATSTASAYSRGKWEMGHITRGSPSSIPFYHVPQ